MSRQQTLLRLSTRFFANEPPKKFKNFSEISQGMAETAKPTSKAPEATKPGPISPPRKPPTASASPSKTAAKPSAAKGASNAPAGDAYMVPEYSKHNEYSFYDFNTEMFTKRMPQPRAERRD